jgi:hypothetical protein
MDVDRGMGPNISARRCARRTDFPPRNHGAHGSIDNDGRSREGRAGGGGGLWSGGARSVWRAGWIVREKKGHDVARSS